MFKRVHTLLLTCSNFNFLVSWASLTVVMGNGSRRPKTRDVKVCRLCKCVFINNAEVISAVMARLSPLWLAHLRTLMINGNSALQPRLLGPVKPVSVCARRSSAWPSREEPDSRENHDRGNLHLIRQSGREAPWRPSEASKRPSHLETKPVCQKLGQHMSKVFFGY